MSVEGRVEISSRQRDVAGTAIRYLGPDVGRGYAEQNPSSPTTVVVRLIPEHWRTQDFSAGNGEAPVGDAPTDAG